MKSKQIMSLFLSIVIVLGICGIPVLADTENAVNAYITISRYGEIVKDSTGKAIAAAPIELKDKASYTLDDAFRAAHDLYYDGGADLGYSSDEGEYGLYITEFWGDESGNFGYQVNGGTEAVMGLSHEVENGDLIDVCIYENTYPDTEHYTKFDKVKAEAFVNEGLELTLSEADWNNIFSPCTDAEITVNGTVSDIITDADGRAVISFDTAGEYVVSAVKTKEINNQSVTAICAPVCVVTVKNYPDASITVPRDTELYVGLKGSKNFVTFTEMLPCAKKENGEETVYYYELEDNKTYNYRITSERYITYAGKFKKTAGFSLQITEEMLNTEGKTKTTIDRDTSSNNGYNVADIYLNINPQGYLKLEQNDTYQLVNLRNWEAVDSVSANYFIEPDYHYTVIDEKGDICDSVVTVNDSGLITAVGEGTAVVLVTYDALNLDFGSGKSFYGAVWPENTGVFVVSVGVEESGISTGMTINEGKNSSVVKLAQDAIDAEHDYIYFIGDKGEYTFTPVTDGCLVSVANPTVSTELSYNGFREVIKNSDNSYTVPLTEGRNIVRLTKEGKSEYQIITAKRVDVTVNNGDEIHPGDNLSIVFDTLYHPANKLAGVYNMNAVAVYTHVSSYENKYAGGLAAQYNFASNVKAQTVSNILKEKDTWGVISYEKDTDLAVPADYAYDTFTLSGGMLYAAGWGDPYGNHRGITLTDGKAPNFNADARLGWLGRLPDIEIPIAAPAGELISISLDTERVKRDYYPGDSFDTSNLIVTANYTDDQTQIVSSYNVTPAVLEKDTQKVTITYQGKTAEIDVNVTVPTVTAIEVTSPPAKTSYKKGEVFDPTGMVITAVYSNGTRKAVTEYSYSPNRILETTDTEMTVTYTGEDKAEGLKPVIVPITVSASSGGGSISNNITVYFTLYGDEKHGEPDNSTGTHTMASNNLETWISKTAVTVEKGSYVIDAVVKALSIAGIPYTNSDGYISEIRGLAELDNGSLSGWMYTLNGRYPELSVAEQTLKNGDIIVFHYTDDYTKDNRITDDSSGSSSGGSSGSSFGGVSVSPAYYTVKFETNGAGAVSSQSIVANGTVTEPQKPEKEGYTFAGWFTDAALTKEYDFTAKVTGSLTLYAKWTEGAEASGENKNGNIFADVSKDSWYYEAVEYVYENKLMQGTDKGFEPEGLMTRAMLVTVLYRMENPTEEYEKSIFLDVPEDEWYSDSVAWAAANGIVTGINDREFAPNENITREQIAVIIYRYAKLKSYDISENTNILSYEDFDEISEYAVPAMQWAADKGIINGKTDSTLNPSDYGTRAQLAAILMRFAEMNK